MHLCRVASKASAPLVAARLATTAPHAAPRTSARRANTQQQQQHAHTQRTNVGAAPTHTFAAQRWITSNSSNSSDSEPRSATSAAPSLLLLTAIGGSVLGGALLLSSNGVSAEAAVVSPSEPLPLLPLDDSVLPPVAPALGGGLGATGGKKTKRKKKRGAAAREPLAYPGKYSSLHREASSVVQVATSQGLRAQVPLVGFEPQQGVQDKQLTLIPVLEMGGQNGTNAQLIVHTNLGSAHKLESTWDTTGGASGSYKYARHDGRLSGWSIKPSVHMAPQGSMVACDIEYKMREGAFVLSSTQGIEWTMNFARALTPNLVGGVEFHHAIQQFTHLNGGFRYISSDRKEQIVVSKKDTKYLATYYRQVAESPHFVTTLSGGQSVFPPCTTELAVEASVNSASLKSDAVVGVRHVRSTFQYHLSLSASPVIALDVQVDPLFGVPLKVGVNAAVPLDSQNDAQIGVSFMFQI